MEPEAAAGILLFRLQKTPQFLLYNYDSFFQRRHWAPPKGKLIGKEEELKCAIRQTSDLTGLNPKDFEIFDGYSYKITYLTEKNKPKSVTYFLALISDYGRIMPQGDGIKFDWFSPEQASEKVIYRNMQDLIKQAVEAIEKIMKEKFHQMHQNQFLNPQQPPQRSPRIEGRAPAKNSPPQYSIRNDRMENFDGDKGKYSPNPNFQNRQKEGFINQQFQQSQQQQDPTYKTRLCQTFEKNGSCPYESRCTFAHGLQELRERPVTSTQNTEIKGTDNTKLKTRLCARFMEQNFCEFGSRCTFAHGQEELRTIDNSSPQIRNITNQTRDLSLTSNQNQHYNSSSSLQSNSSPTLGSNLNSNSNSSLGSISNRNSGNDQFSSTIQDKNYSTQKDQPKTSDISSKPQRSGPRQKNIDKTANRNALDTLNDDKSWIQNVELTEEELQKFQANEPKKKQEKVSVEEQLIKELAQFVSVSRTPEEVKKELTRKELKYELPYPQILSLLFSALFAEGDIPSKIETRIAWFKEMTQKEQDQVNFLRAFEKFVSRHPSQEPQILYIMKCLFDQDLVEEDAFLAWDRGEPKSTFYQKGKKFMDWLKSPA